MELKVKEFDELTTRELYNILKARALVFQLEENIRYLDMDGKDYESLHCFIEKDGETVAYMRAYTTDTSGVIQLGRVLTVLRGQGLGKRLLTESIPILKNRLEFELIRLDSQEHAVGFYKRLGFTVCSETFLEEGIPHVKMELRVRE